MDNAAFRKLLETPRAERWGSQTPSNKPSSTPRSTADGEHKAQRPHKPHGRPGSKKPAEKGKGDEEDDEEGSKYRDRAEERRRGKNADYEDASAVLAALAAGGSGGPAGGVDLSKLSEEETKYLGGDMRFTHLVKGLDYALLQKTRGEITTKAGDGTADDDDADEDVGRDTRARDAARANAASAAARKEDITFTTPLARAVFSTLFTALRSNVREMYQPRRTAFVYDFDNEDSLDTDIPTTLRRPKSECPPAPETLFAAVDNAVLERIARILSYVRTSADGRKLKKKDRDALLGIKHTEEAAAGAHPPGAAPGGGAVPAAAGAARPAGRPAPADEDDDIFGDAGTQYAPTVKKDKGKGAANGAGQEGRRADGSYFDKKDTMADIPTPGASRKGPAAAPAAAGGGGGGDDMDLEDGEEAPPPPPPPPPGAMPYAGQAHPQQYGAEGYGGMQQQGYEQGYGGYGQQQGYEQGAMAAYPAAGGAYGAAAQAQAYGAAYPVQDPSAAYATGTAEEPKWRSRPKDTKARTLEADGDDAYAECYPGMAGLGDVAGDSDEEGADLRAMDSKQAGKGMSRADFATDEEWQRHKESRETLPRAAFQFGVKRADGRKSHKELEKGAVAADKQRDQKLDGQLRKIERILVDKGHDHGPAFERKAKAKKGEGEGGGGGGGGRGDETPSVFRKRQRI